MGGDMMCEERQGCMADSIPSVERLPVFVYGSLRVGEGNYRRLAEGNTEREVAAVLPGHRMYRNWIYDDIYPCVVDGAADEAVLGDLLDLRADRYESVLATLDQLEMYDPATHSGPYLRVRRVAFAADDAERAHPIEAWVYHASSETLASRTPGDHIPGGDWLAHRRSYGEQR